MKFVYDNWSLIVAAIVTIIYFISSGKKSVSNWLLMAVMNAEQYYGSGTGRLKLAEVYNDFVHVYPIMSKIIPFAVFSAMVDSALAEMRHIFETNEKIKEEICGGV